MLVWGVFSPPKAKPIKTLHMHEKLRWYNEEDITCNMFVCFCVEFCSCKYKSTSQSMKEKINFFWHRQRWGKKEREHGAVCMRLYCSFMTVLIFYDDKIASDLIEILSLLLRLMLLPSAEEKMFRRNFEKWNRTLFKLIPNTHRHTHTHTRGRFTCINTCFLQQNFDFLPHSTQKIRCSYLWNDLRVFCRIFQYALPFVYVFCSSGMNEKVKFFWNKHFDIPAEKSMWIIRETFSAFAAFAFATQTSEYIHVHICIFIYEAKEETKWSRMLSDKHKSVLLNFPDCNIFLSPSPLYLFLLR